MIRLHQRRLFWQQFPVEFEFKRGGANEIRFVPRKSSKAAAIQGSLKYDASTFEVLRMDYEFVGDSAVGLMKVPSGTSVSMEMVRGGELYSLVSMRRRGGARNAKSLSPGINFHSPVKFGRTEQLEVTIFTAGA